MLNKTLLAMVAMLGLGNSSTVMPPLFAGLASPRTSGGAKTRDRRGPGQTPNQGHFASKWPGEGPRAPFGSNNHNQAKNGWFDRHGLPHGRSGDKLVRKARRGLVAVSHSKAKV